MSQQTTGLEDYIQQKLLGEFMYAEVSLSIDAEWNSKFSAIGKIVLIFLGAFVATKEVANQFLGANSGLNTLIFTVAGLVIATVAGLDAAFKWDKTSADLKGLSVTCQINKRDGESELQKALQITSEDEKRAALEKIMDTLTHNLDEVCAKAATLGINIVLETRTKKQIKTKTKKQIET
jgi:hypothetical protein